MEAPSKASLEYQFVWAWPHGACEVVCGLPEDLASAIERTGLLELLGQNPGAYVLELTIRPDFSCEELPAETPGFEAFLAAQTEKLKQENAAGARRTKIKPVRSES